MMPNNKLRFLFRIGVSVVLPAIVLTVLIWSLVANRVSNVVSPTPSIVVSPTPSIVVSPTPTIQSCYELSCQGLMASSVAACNDGVQQQGEDDVYDAGNTLLAVDDLYY